MTSKAKAEDRKEGRSEWTAVFFRRSTRDSSLCDKCDKEIKKGDIIFYFPQLKNRLGKKGAVYCFECFIKKVKELSVIEVL